MKISFLFAMSDSAGVVGRDETRRLKSGEPSDEAHKKQFKVILFRTELLPSSETFIREQALALNRWHPVLVGRRLSTNGLPLNGLTVRLAEGWFTRVLTRIAPRVSKKLNMVHRSTLKAFREIGAQLVHAHFGLDAVDIWPVVRELGLPMLVTLYGYDINIDRGWWESGNGGLSRRSYPRQLLQLASEPRVHIIAVSEAIRKRAIECGIPEAKITVSYLGANTEKFQPGRLPIVRRDKRILFVGRLVEKKGAEYLLRAFSKVRDFVKEAELVVIGDGPLRVEVRALAALLNLPVEFLGTLPVGEVKAQLDQARVLCVPSVIAKNGDAEGLPMIILEAQAAGVPVATSAQGAVGEAVVHLETGLVFREKSTDELADNLIKALLDDELMELIAERARAQVFSRFNLSQTIQQLQSVYDHMRA